jgi:hypothetical protein
MSQQPPPTDFESLEQYIFEWYRNRNDQNVLDTDITNIPLPPNIREIQGDFNYYPDPNDNNSPIEFDNNDDQETINDILIRRGNLHQMSLTTIRRRNGIFGPIGSTTTGSTTTGSTTTGPTSGGSKRKRTSRRKSVKRRKRTSVKRKRRKSKKSNNKSRNK